MWETILKFLPMALEAMGKMGGDQQQGQQAQQPQQSQPQNQFIPPQLMQSKPIPSYGEMINSMLQKTRGF